jgi:uncharacterized protein (TIGR00299 family) protein
LRFRSHGEHGHSHGLAHGHSHGSSTDKAHSHGHGVGVEEGFVPRAAGEPAPEIEPLPPGAGRGKVLYFDMSSGIAGDMVIASLLDLGVPLDVVSAAVESLGISGITLSLRPGYAGAIGCHHFRVSWEDQGRERSFAEIQKLISESPLDPAVRELALRIFLRLAEAEAEVHRTSVDGVHFHEVGAVDAIVDIVGSAAAIVYLGAEIKASPVPLGRGFVQCRHGVLPLPAPATLNCLRGVPTRSSGLEVELVTPTGAAIVATVAVEFVEWCPLTIERLGFGAGTRGLVDRPNVLRAVLGKETPQALPKAYALLEANVDDMTGEAVAYAMDRVVASGAIDTWVVPATMKKGRPAMIFCALSTAAQASEISEAILLHTSSIGVRQTLVSRRELPRTNHRVTTQWGSVRVKTSGEGSSLRKDKPEFDDCATIAKREGLPLSLVLAEVTRIIANSDGFKKS